ncbi:F0F1 ATP synthase subunit B [Clostridium sp. CM028]|uniref:F0F1 ATP synthase subunit B n=1 Tax=Clostridium TaxID=1485 RepID=UPI0016528C09|nr:MULTISPECIES: F0F1 ATP synthase subunit B [Clostridium]MBU3092557.1 F0F1 ATP synthase subunit B [Clostridium sp. CF011]MBW9146242.1 F0F1 ATP synthase subunit B [Clostridium sp. CM027]MBW9149714.1 F0F1 ATP synthase subunit B [Clostridium sp. CM028]MBZ9606399.1 F0F1 ATP synthase subunit B [Clostridium estertheticum]UVE39779.1 F0F1 ATP synthase subunit B [Clostridium sp. CM027]
MDLGNIIAAMINFLILLFIAKRYLFTPVNRILDTRKQELNSSFEQARNDKEEAKRLKIENGEKLNLAKKEGKEIVEKYKQKAEKISGELIKDAKKEALLIIERSRVEIDREREKAQSEIKKQVIDLSLVLSEKALGQHIGEEEHRRLIEDFIFKVGS